MTTTDTVGTPVDDTAAQVTEFWRTLLAETSEGVPFARGLVRRSGGQPTVARLGRALRGRPTEAPLSGAVLSATHQVLTRYSSDADVLFWVTRAAVAEAAGTPAPADASWLLPLRLQGRRSDRVADVLADAGRQAAVALAHAVVDPDDLRRTARPGGPGLPTVGLALDGDPAPPVDLLFRVGHEDASLAVEYRDDLFDSQVMASVLEAVVVLLDRMAGATDQVLGELPLLSEAEAAVLLREWSGPPARARDFVPVHQRVAARAAEAPDSIAVISGTAVLSYRRLEELAGRLAVQLQDAGAGPGTLVALCTKRSPWMVVGMLAALKTGAAYLPLDPAHPAARLAFQLEDAGPVVLLTESRVRDRVPKTDLRCIELDEALAQGSPSSVAPLRPVSPAAPSDLAYVIYTSGSTGRPKGVEVPLSGLDNLIGWHQGAAALSAADHLSHLAGVAFDAAVWEIWPTLAIGATLHLAEDVSAMSPADLVRWLVEQEITVAFLPTALAELVLDEPWPADCALRRLHTGGDALHRHPPAGLPFTLVNHYGPTENSVVATSTDVPADPGRSRGEPSIGRPISNTLVRVLDERMRLLPIGAPGELYIGGAGLALGYRRRPDLTAQRFVPDPFGPGRLYRTGDLVSWRPDGSIDFLGRVDAQVSLRGLRIELGEVETALLGHPDVAEAAVVLREDTPGHSRLVAYAVSRSVPRPEASHLRAWLAETLPSYMVPNAFVRLPALPLTPNGKVDRTALPAPAGGRAEELGPYIQPLPGDETLVADIWEELLGSAPVGALDGFLDLGGDSLTATRTVARLADASGVAVPVSVVLSGPTVRVLAETLTKLRGTAGPVPAAPVRRVARTDHPRLTDAQRQLWLLDRLDDGGTTYSVPLTIALAGPLRADVLQHALRGVIERQEALRTSFPVQDGQPVQRIAESIPDVGFEVVDAAVVGDVDEWVVALAQQPFAMDTGPLMRASLVRRAEDDHLLVIVVHHVVFDGWSLGVFCRELGELYRAEVQGTVPDLPTLSVQSADLAVWQAEHLTAEALAGEREHWVRTLAGAPALLELPTDFPRPAALTSAGARCVLELDAVQSRRLAEFARAQGATPFMTLFAAFNVLLNRYTGAEDIVVGSPVAGRIWPGTEPLIGCFINTLPLRTDLSGAPSFRQLVDRVRATAVSAHDHQVLPLSHIIDAVRPDRSASQSPLFQVVFAFEDAHESQFEVAGLRAQVTEVDFRSTRSDLGISITPVGDRLRLCAEYRAQLFTEDTVHRLLTAYQTLLDSALAEPDAPIGELAVLTTGQRQQIVEEWNRTAAPFPDGATVHELVERQVDATPDATAVVFENERTLTYRELDESANRLAHHLRDLGVEPESRVGICLERSPEVIVAVLGVLKAGGAYVPLDPANPPERLAFIAGDANLRVVLTQQTLHGLCSWGDAVVVEMDGVERALAERPVSRPAPRAGAASLAYVIYTSGSTGRPKGVMIEHRSVCNFVTSVHRLFEMGPQDNVIQFASLGFDVSVFEIFSALTCGARLCLARQDTLLSIRALTAFMQQNEISVMDLPPSVMALLPGGQFPALRIAFVGGEAFSGGLVDAWQAPGRRFFNGYGPTEGTVTVIVEECAAARTDQSPPIGRPMANMRAYVLDADDRLVPVGVPGQLHIGGVGLARAYLDRPELTEEKFIPDPFVAEPGSRLYRTGDLVRQLPDGRLDFLGRIDHQVKLRGVRIELGEIEEVLREHPEVVDAAVLLREDAPGQRRLVGYVIVQDAVGSPTPAALNSHLRDRLPRYMVPAAVVVLDRFPLTANGKVDRSALPAPAMEDLTAGEVLVEPRTRREATLAEIWARLLDLPRVGVQDSFFALGGHSLLAVQLVWEVHRAFGVDISVRDVFERPTIAQLAVVVEEAMLARLAVGHPPELPTASETKGQDR